MNSDSGPDSSPKKLKFFNGIPLDPINKVFDSPGLGSIYIGDIDAARDVPLLKSLGIGAVLTVCPFTGLYYTSKDIPFHKIISAEDQENYNIHRHFQSAFYFIQQARRSTNILVHCQAGVSRSPTMVISYLMRKERLKCALAYSKVKSRRRLTCPNLGFCQQLKQYEIELGLIEEKGEQHQTTNATVNNPQEESKVVTQARQTLPSFRNYKPYTHSNYFKTQVYRRKQTLPPPLSPLPSLKNSQVDSPFRRKFYSPQRGSIVF